jgi:HK97 family phage prohead protease
MPYSKPSDAPDSVPKSKKGQWVEVWNSVYKKAKADGKSDKEAEGEAFKQANGVVKSDERKFTTMAKREIRSITELRAEQSGDDMVLTGYAALFNSKSKDLGGFVEEIAPGAFTRSLKEKADVKATFNHNPDLILGRTKAGSLTLTEDERGLRWRCVLDRDNSFHRDLYASVKRMDIDECSFAFTVTKDNQDWRAEQIGEDAWIAVRTLKDVDLIDVSAVTYPAYNGTSVDARCLFPDGEIVEIRSAIESLKAQRAQAAETREAGESFEESIREVAKALNEKYPATYDDGTPVPASYNCGKYWIVETYENYVIACDFNSGKYYKIPYVENETNGEANETFTFGALEEVVQDWKPADARSAQRVAEFRTAKDAAIAAKPAAPAESRSRAESFEEQLHQTRRELDKAVQAANPDKYTYLVETYADHVIVCVCGYNEKDEWVDSYYSATYSKGADGAYQIGELKPVELDWVASERAAKSIAEWRTAVQAKRDMGECECDCPECEAGNCADCTDEGCDCDGCDDCGQRSAKRNAPPVTETAAAPAPVAPVTETPAAVTGDGINNDEFVRAARIRAANAMCN